MRKFNIIIDIIIIILLLISIGFDIADAAPIPGPEASLATSYELEEGKKVQAFNKLVSDFSLTVTGDQWKLFDQIMDAVEKLDQMRIQEAYRQGSMDTFLFLKKYGSITDEQITTAAERFEADQAQLE